MENALFIFAHLDDETILSYGTLLKFANLGINCHVCCICGNGRDQTQQFRIDAFSRNMKDANMTYSTYDNYDLSLTSDVVKKIVCNEINHSHPHTIVTHSIHDLHFEHRLVSEQVLLCCRLVPNVGVRRLWNTVSTTEKWTYGQFGVFQPNVFVDTTAYATAKRKALERYGKELAFFPDNRSVESILHRNQEDGYRIGTEYAESYEQLFEVI